MTQKVWEIWYVDHSTDKLFFISVFRNKLVLPQIPGQFSHWNESSYSGFIRWRGCISRRLIIYDAFVAWQIFLCALSTCLPVNLSSFSNYLNRIKAIKALQVKYSRLTEAKLSIRKCLSYVTKKSGGETERENQLVSLLLQQWCGKCTWTFLCLIQTIDSRLSFPLRETLILMMNSYIQNSYQSWEPIAKSLANSDDVKANFHSCSPPSTFHCNRFWRLTLSIYSCDCCPISSMPQQKLRFHENQILTVMTNTIIKCTPGKQNNFNLTLWAGICIFCLWKRKKRGQNGTLICKSMMEVTGENHILDHSVNFFLSSVGDKLLLRRRSYQSHLQGMNYWDCNKCRL